MADDRQSLSAGQRVLRVGCTQMGTHSSRYFRRFSALELQQSFFNPPRPSTLERLRRQAPQGFGFVVKAWQLITHPADSPSYRRLGSRRLWAAAGEFGLLRPTAAVQEALRVTMQTATALAADAVLFETPPAFAPSAQSRSRLTHFFEHLQRDGLTLVWDPRGLWSRTEAGRICADLGLVLCSDPTQDDSLLATSGVAPIYYRISGIGRQRALGDSELLDLQARLAEASGHCIFDTLEMHRDATRLLALLSPGEAAP